MKKFKKMMALVIAMVMVVAMSMTAMAAGTGSITINNANNITSTHSYEAYQVFSGNLSADGTTLSDIQWGSGVNGAALLEALKDETAYAACESAQDVAKVLAGFENDSTQLEAFNAIVAQNLKASGKVEGDSEDGITGLDYGYWFVKDVTEMPEEGTDALSAYILQVVGQATLNIKADAPSITKKIVEGTNRVDSNNVAIGDTVTYEIKTAVPDMTSFNNYYFYVEDTLSKGLTYDTTHPVTVTIGGTAYALETGELTVGTYNETTGTPISIDFKRLYAQFNDAQNTQVVKNAEIVITYSAILNEKAVIGESGNPNTVKLTYTNDATWDGTGTPSEGPKGVTPEDLVITYVTKIEVTKKDATTKAALEGAVFKIEGTPLNTVIVEGEVFEESTTGTYYKLKDGSYTTTVPTAANSDSYASTETKYAKTTKQTITKTEDTPVSYEVVSGADGKLSFTGLKEGTYTITEIAAPAGYNKLESPITVNITWTKPTKADVPGLTDPADKCTWKYSTSGAVTTAVTTATGGVITFDVENAGGTVLPSTGGIGTTIFYIIGAVLVLGAGILLVTRRRMNAN